MKGEFALIVETYKNLFDCDADIIIDLIGMCGDCHPGHAISVQCTDVMLEATKVYNTYRPEDHWGHCYMVDSRCKLKDSGRVWVALLSASEKRPKRTDCVANLMHLESALKELDDWIEQSGYQLTVGFQYLCGAGWVHEWQPILDIVSRVLEKRKVYICHGQNSEMPLPDTYGQPQPKQNWLAGFIDFLIH